MRRRSAPPYLLAWALAALTPVCAPFAARAQNYGAFLTAQVAVQQADDQKAADDMIRALAADPDNANLQHSAFLLALLAGRADAVKLAASQAGDPFAELLIGDDHARAGAWQPAEIAYAELKHEGFTEILGPLLTAWAQFGQGETERALATLQPLAEGQHFPAIYALHAAMIADLAHRDGEAARLYEEASHAFKGNNLRLAQVLASFVWRNGDQTRARAIIHDVVAQNPEIGIIEPSLIASLGTPPVASAKDGIAEAYLAMAATLQQQDQTDFASLLLRLSIGMRPDLSATRMLMADIEAAHRHPAAALRDLSKIADSDPLHAMVQLRQAGLMAVAGEDAGAQALLAQVAASHPTRAEPLVLLGDVRRDGNDYPGAVAAYDQAIARLHDPVKQDWTVYFSRGVALDRAHDWPRAEADMMQALKLAPDEPTVLNYLGYSWALQGRDLQQAQSFIQKALDQRPNDGAIIDSLGWVKLRLGDTSGAVRALEKAVELEPADPTITGHLGDAYWDAGRHGEAEDQWRRALVLKPEPEDRVRIETRLRSAEALRP